MRIFLSLKVLKSKSLVIKKSDSKSSNLNQVWNQRVLEPKLGFCTLHSDTSNCAQGIQKKYRRPDRSMMTKNFDGILTKKWKPGSRRLDKKKWKEGNHSSITMALDDVTPQWFHVSPTKSNVEVTVTKAFQKLRCWHKKTKKSGVRSWTSSRASHFYVACWYGKQKFGHFPDCHMLFYLPHRYWCTPIVIGTEIWENEVCCLRHWSKIRGNEGVFGIADANRF